jgi:hypothetical protein
MHVWIGNHTRIHKEGGIGFGCCSTGDALDFINFARCSLSCSSRATSTTVSTCVVIIICCCVTTSSSCCCCQVLPLCACTRVCEGYNTGWNRGGGGIMTME